MNESHITTIFLISVAYIYLYHLIRVPIKSIETYKNENVLSKQKGTNIFISIGTLAIPLIISFISFFLFCFFRGEPTTNKGSGVYITYENGGNAQYISILWLIFSLTIFLFKYDKKKRNSLCSAILIIMTLFIAASNYFIYLEDEIITY